MDKIFACGVPRTGSTLIWNILVKAYPGRTIIKKHPGSWNPEEGIIIGSIRYPYDTAASCFRTRIVGDKGDGIDVQGTRKGLISELMMMTNNFRCMRDLVDNWGAIVLRYERFFNDFDYIFDALEERIGKISQSVKKRIKEEYSFEAVRNRLLDANPGDLRIDRMGVSHVALGYPGAWKAIIPFWGYDTLKKWCDPLCQEWGYAN